MSKVLCNLAVFLLLASGTIIAISHDLNASPKTSVLPANESHCGYEHVRIKGNPPVRGLDFCQPLSRVMAFFQSMGFEFEPRFSLITTSRLDADQAHSYGNYDAAIERITIFRIGKKTPWNLDLSKEIYNSIAVHEMVHMAVLRILGENYSRLPKEWHEFIAYSVQIDLLDRPLRDRVLDRNEDVLAFTNLLSVNPYIYGLAGSDLFSVQAYKTYCARGGPAFVQDLLRFKFSPPPFIDIFPLPPQIR